MTTSAGQPDARGPGVLRVVSYNILGARYREPLREVVRALEADVLIVNETPKLPLLWRWQCDRLAAEWGMIRAAGGRDAGSNMICVSHRVRVVRTTARRLAQPRFQPRRGIVTMQASLGGVAFGVVGVHLSLLEWSRPREAVDALADSRGLGGALLLCGDLNEKPEGSCWRTFREAGLTDCAEPDELTWSSTEPVKRIDAVLVHGARVLRHEVPVWVGEDLLGKASDHRPVLADLDLAVEPKG